MAKRALFSKPEHWEVHMTKTRNRLISVGIALLVLIAAALFIIPQKTAGAESWIDSATKFAGGDGTQGTPYQISSAEELAYLAMMVNGGETYDGKYFELTAANIDLYGKEWTPIGTSDKQFLGEFNGNGNTISNLTISGGDNLGLFAYSSGEIKSVYLDNVNITTSLNAGNAGGVCAFNNGTIDGCGVLSGAISCASSNGGQLGGISKENSGTISRCFSNAAIKGANSAGIVYVNRGNGVVQNCYNAGTIEGLSTAGGISNNNYGKITTCLNLGEIIAKDVTDEDGYVEKRGFGICAMNQPGASLENCYSDSDVCPKELFGGFRNTTVYYKTTAELCDSSFLNDLNSNWESGSESGETNGRYRTAIYTYPSLKGVGTAATRKGGQTYDFSVGAIGKKFEDFTYIEKPEDFKNIAKNLSGNYVLKTDIDFKGEVIEPIGDSESVTGSGLSAPFSGNFSGDGHKILNVTVKRELGSHSGLFGANKGTIINLAVEADVSGTAYVGGICASNESGGRIADCSFSGTVNGTKSYVGGICGENKGGILRCAADGTVSGDSSVGGICGSNSGGDIENCLNSSDVTRKSSNGNIGGIVGESVDNSTVNYCISVGKTAGAGSTYIGGVCGYAYRATITNSYFDSEVSAGLKAIYDAFDDRDTETLKGLTTAGLSGELPTDFADKVWQAGRSEVTAIDGRAGTRTATYISLKNVGTPKVLESTPVYNFSLDGTVTWETYEPVASVGDFRKIDENLSGNYVLAGNINFGCNNYLPIAYKSGTSFTGKFSGNGHTISNIKVEYTDDLVGLFGTNKGLIMNLAVSGEVTGEGYIGGICAKNEGTIYSCSFDGEVKQLASTLREGKVGGICGINYATISNCFNSADVSGKNYIGGICGEMYGKDPVVVYCVSVGKVSGFTSSAIVGGICGIGNGVSYGVSSELSHCRFDMDVSGSINLINNGDKITKRGDNDSCRTETLCSNEIGSFNPDIWNAGKGVVVTPDAKDGKFGTKTCYYMSLKCFGEPKPITGYVYNFAFAGGDADWQPYILISSENVFRTYWQWDVKWSENFVLGDDITLAYSLAPSDLIPTSLSTGTFSGMFSGNGHTVTLTDGSTCGLFGTNKGTIINLAVKGNIDSSLGSNMRNYSGGICAVNDGTIYGCSFEGKIYGGANNTGAVCGLNNKTISNCFALANVKATNGQVGGIAALGKEDSKLQDCYFVGTVTTNATGLGVISVTSSKNCYYNNEVCQFDKEESGKALTTLDMTSNGALKKMGFDEKIWEKRLNDTENGVAYYPSLKGSTYVPSIKYTTKLELNRVGDEEPVYDDDITFTTKATITFENDYYGDDISAEDNTGSFNAEVGGRKYTIIDNTFTDIAAEAGDVIYKLIHSGSDYFPKDYYENFVVKVGMKALTVYELNVELPDNRTFSNTAKEVTVTPQPDIRGVGELTVKYYDESGNPLTSAPVNAGTYTFKISAAVGDNYKAAADLSDESWKFTIEKAAAKTLPDTEVSYRWSTDKDITVNIAGLPENMGQVTVDRAKKDGTIVAGIFPNTCYSDGKLAFHLGPNTVDDIGKTGTFTVKLVTDNYESVTFTVKINLTNKDNQEAPDPAAFDVVFTNDGSNLTATISTALKGVEYSFDGTTWSDVNTTTVAHLVDVTAYIRYAETDELNFSETVYKTVNSGHGALIHHEAVQATCRHDGSTEYWECAACAKFYSDEAATTEVALADTILAKTDHKWAVKYAYNKDSHWHKCEYCDATTEAESHVSSGEATTKTAEYCTVCGYIITPKKGGGSSGGHVSSGVHNRDNTTETNPAINGTQKTWTDIAADLDKQGGGSATISMNGETKIPADVIKAIADKKIKVEFVYDGTKSWLVDGAKITAVSAVDFSLLPGSVDAGSLRGVSGGKYRISANIPADLKFAFQKQYAGEFVNVYKLVDGELVFRTCAKLAEDGTAVISGMDAAGEYAVMVCRYSDRQGDVDNNGVLDIADALALLRYSVGVDSGESLQLIDFNGDGKVDMADARTVLRWSFGLSA